MGVSINEVIASAQAAEQRLLARLAGTGKAPRDSAAIRVIPQFAPGTQELANVKVEVGNRSMGVAFEQGTDRRFHTAEFTQGSVSQAIRGAYRAALRAAGPATPANV